MTKNRTKQNKIGTKLDQNGTNIDQSPNRNKNGSKTKNLEWDNLLHQDKKGHKNLKRQKSCSQIYFLKMRQKL